MAAAVAVTTKTTCRMRVCGPVAAATSAASPVTVSLGDLPQQKRSPATATTTTSSGSRSPVVVEKRAIAAAAEEEEAAVVGTKTTLASVWREVQGAGDWRGMVEPLHPLLREEVVRYGEFVAACYRAFDLDPASKRYLNCKHGKKQMLPAVGMAGAGYRVTKYIYAAPDVALPFGFGVSRYSCAGKSRWIGYVAVASNVEARRLGRRDILVSFRGTVTGSEWLANFMSALSPARFDPADPRPDVRVESGFLSLYTSDDLSGKFTCGSCRNQLLSEVTRLIAKYKHEDISVTLAGHSMGSSLAILLGYDLAELGLNRDGGRGGGAIPITVFSFGGPRVGNVEFKNRCDELGVKVLRVANARDPVTKMPGVVFNEAAARVFVPGGRLELPWSKACYTHVGVEVALDFFKASDVACVHDLDAYINNLLDGGATAASTTILESWRWQMAAIRAGELLQTLGI
uniref:Phospholipase A1 EG1, chloroplastic/mitochondrial n=1 Tax=Oryza punctata TaxID=4537 RepID=A0A0E0MEU6_ORYPU